MVKLPKPKDLGLYQKPIIPLKGPQGTKTTHCLPLGEYRGSIFSVSITHVRNYIIFEKNLSRDAEAAKDGKGKGWKPEGVGQARKKKSRRTGDAIGVASMEEDPNSLNIFIVEQQKSEDFLPKKAVWVHVV